MYFHWQFEKEQVPIVLYTGNRNDDTKPFYGVASIPSIAFVWFISLLSLKDQA